MMQRITPALASPPRVVLVRGVHGDQESDLEQFDTLLRSAPALAGSLAVSPDAVKVLMYTSGTTGRPKGVLHSHNSLHADSVKMESALQLIEEDA